MATVEDVFKNLEPVMDPEHPISITDPRMSIVTKENIEINNNEICVRFKPTVPYCPMGGLIGVLIRYRLEEVYPDSSIQVSVLPGTHMSENVVNTMINDETRYSQVVAQMKEQGMIS